MDIITKSLFDEFCRAYGYTNMEVSEAFERFVSYCVLSKYVKTESISKNQLEEISIGSGGDWGLDGFIILVNNRVVNTQEMVDDILAMSNTISVRILLVQAKTSNNFDVAEFGQTLDGVEYLCRDVMGEVDFPICNDDLVEYRELLKYIYSKSSYFTDSKNPIFEVYFATCGVYNAQEDFKAKILKSKSLLASYQLMSTLECIMMGRQDVVAAYKETKSKNEVDLRVEQKIALPEVDKIDDAYLCLIPFPELRKLFVAEGGELKTDVFYDNVRAYQGDNIVNKSMKDSIKSGNIDLFAAMNNGITVIAKKMQPTGMNIHLTDYQIVNGCQTCNVLFACQNVDNIDKLKISVKLIASVDKEIRDKIIVANNSQTEVKREQLVSLLPIQKTIEDYYNAQNRYEKLYYERRARQYTNEVAVPPFKVVTIPNQIKSFISMILSEPDKVRGYYGSIVEAFERAGKTVFADNTNPAFYYTSSLAMYKMEEFFSRKKEFRKYKKVKFHVLYAIRLFAETEPLPALTSNKSQRYCDSLCERLNNDMQFEKVFQGAIKMVDLALQRMPKDADRSNSQFTNKLSSIMREVSKLVH